MKRYLPPGIRRVFGRAVAPVRSRLASIPAYSARERERLARVVRRMAETGEGTDECLRHGCLPMLVHFYSPVPDIPDLQARGVFKRRSELPGLDLHIDRQLARLAELGRAYGAECRWPHEPTSDDAQFYTDNSGFSYGCAAAAHMVIRHHKPQRVIEIGSGSSSRVIAAALRANTAAGSPLAEYTIIDPYPADALYRVPGVSKVLKQRAEESDFALFAGLAENDVLFVDSGHTVRAGGDVNFLILDVLPRVRRGVIAHFHDIPMPYEYAEAYFTNPKFRMFWTESYLLQAFLAHNAAFEILLAMNLLMLEHVDAFRAALPAYDPGTHRYPSHSFWIRRKD